MFLTLLLRSFRDSQTDPCLKSLALTYSLPSDSLLKSTLPDAGAEAFPQEQGQAHSLVQDHNGEEGLKACYDNLLKTICPWGFQAYSGLGSYQMFTF